METLKPEDFNCIINYYSKYYGNSKSSSVQCI